MPEKKPFSRLPTNVVPSNYKLTLEPNLADFTFKGSEDITIQVSSLTSFYHVHKNVFCMLLEIKSYLLLLLFR